MKSRDVCWDRHKQARKKIGITQKDLAEALGISPAYLSLLETGCQWVSEEVAIKNVRTV